MAYPNAPAPDATDQRMKPRLFSMVSLVPKRDDGPDRWVSTVSSYSRPAGRNYKDKIMETLLI